MLADLKIKQILETNGYPFEDYQIFLRVYSETNQVLVVNDLVNERSLTVPFEENLMEWPPEKVAHHVVLALDEANEGE